MKCIIEDGEQLDVSDEVAKELVAMDLIYSCDCTGGAFHITPGKTWDDVDAVVEARA